MVTDYDCGHPAHDSVTADQVIANLVQNAATAKAVLRSALQRLPSVRACECGTALKHALVTAPELVPESVKRDLAPILRKYMP
jgi:5'-methylthioadenosine phosphorylase